VVLKELATLGARAHVSMVIMARCVSILLNVRYNVKMMVSRLRFYNRLVDSDVIDVSALKRGKEMIVLSVD